jgi:hypothetical protein
MNPNKALWEKGDFTRIAESMRESGEALVKGLGITKGLKVLDLGCGDGTPEQKPKQGCHLHSCNLLVRYCCVLKSGRWEMPLQTPSHA